MQKVTFINAIGESVELYKTPFFLSRIEGLGDVEADISSRKSPGQDGSTLSDITLSERPIPIEVIILKDYEHNRRLLSKIFNPKLGQGVLIYENRSVRREIKAMSEHVPQFVDHRPRIAQHAGIDLICHNPYWTSEEQAEQLVVWEGGFEFPLTLPTEFARLSKSKAKILTNEGDDETPIHVTFEGPATSPIAIENISTGEFIKVNQSLLDGEKLEINTAFGQKSVTKILLDGTRLNAFHHITLDSSLFNLQIGNNLIDYSTGGEYERAGVVIRWRNLYTGV